LLFLVYGLTQNINAQNQQVYWIGQSALIDANDICGVVNQKTGSTCQFSWVCMPTFTDKRLTIKSTPLYNEVRKIAMNVVFNYENLSDITKGATYYHADYVNPGWKLPKTTKIGAHIFYKRESDLKTMTKEIKL
jgi:spore germination cell wall hydrolase CwlJ-like protein